MLLMNEMPDNIEDVFSSLSLSLLPRNERDFITDCSCPDWANPCKHIAGVYYLVASEFDRDPFLMFELRGLSREGLQKELSKSPLGKALLSQLNNEGVDPESSKSYFTVPKKEKVKKKTEII